MSAEDDYPAYGAIGGTIEFGHDQYVRMCDEIDRLRAEVDVAKRIPKVSDDRFCLSVRGNLRCENPIGHDGFHWNESHKIAWTDDSAPASYTVRPRRSVSPA